MRLFGTIILVVFAAGYLIRSGGLVRRTESPQVSNSTAAQRTTGAATSDDSTEPSVNLSHIVTLRNRQQADQLDSLLDHSRAEWDTETFSDQATSQLALIAAWIAHPNTSPVESLATIVAEGFRCEPLRVESLRRVAGDPRVSVFRPSSPVRDRPLDLEGTNGFATGLRQLTSALGHDDAARHVHLKIYRVQVQETEIETTVKLEAAGRSDNQVQQVSATWACTWETSGQSAPRLMTVRVLDYEEVILDGADKGWLSDCSMAVLGDVPSFRDELQFGMDHWVNRLDRRLMISRFGHHGLAVADINGDGWDDIYVCQPGGLPNRVYIQNADGTARDASSVAGLDYLDSTTSAIFADLDNDGDQDLVLATVATLAVLENDGKGVFRPRAVMPECDRSFSLSVVDYDQDGRLDIFACRYRRDAKHDFELPLPVPYHDANNGGGNQLFRNVGNLAFQDVTDDVGLSANNSRFSFAAAWEDYDNDGDQDLYVANDYGRNCLYRNDEGHFTDVAASAQVEDIASGMSVTWSDYDHDGRMDLYISNMFSSAGNRISFQDHFAAQHDEESRSQIQRHARGNTLFKNRSELGTNVQAATDHFQDVSVQQRVSLGRWAWGSLFADINNDGWDDLLIVNGLMTTEDTGDL